MFSAAMWESSGAYTADRAAALAGVPKSTIHYWARTDVLEPSVSKTKVKLWSHADLIALRTIYWLRQQKPHKSGKLIPATTMPSVRRALAALRKHQKELYDSNGEARVLVDASGNIYLRHSGGSPVDVSGGQTVLEFVDLIAPFSMVRGTQAPDLIRPRPHLRIVPGRLSGSPHIENTRVETCAIAALSRRGFDIGRIRLMYPFLDLDSIRDAIDLEDQLTNNLTALAA